MPNTVILKGFDEFANKLRDLPKELKSEIDFVVKDAAALWEERAKMDAPVDQGALRAAISVKKVDEMEYEVVSPSEYSAFVEWGTKKKVQIPAGIESYAAKWRNISTPGGAKAIYDWCRRVGIPQNQWVFVYLSIMANGINPHPYFFPQRPLVETQLLNDVKQILNTEH